jgi:hypothetical protein
LSCEGGRSSFSSLMLLLVTLSSKTWVSNSKRRCK